MEEKDTMNRALVSYLILLFLFPTLFETIHREIFVSGLKQEKEEEDQTSQTNQTFPCKPTPSTGLGPFYEPNAPERTSVGEGHILSGIVRSSVDCSPIEGARIEIWLAGPDGKYSDEYRATMYSKKSGEYKFESHFPPPYSGRPSHIHVKVEAKGYKPLITQFYPMKGEMDSKFNLVLVPMGQ